MTSHALKLRLAGKVMLAGALLLAPLAAQAEDHHDHGGGGGYQHGGGGGWNHGGGGDRRGGGGIGVGGLLLGLGVGALVGGAIAQNYAPPPPVYYAPPPPVYYAPPPAYYAPAPARSCYAGQFVCPLERPTPINGPCACPTYNGPLGGRAS